MNSAAKRRGYSMIEAMVSVALVVVGVVAVLGGFTTLAINQRKALESERMQRLAIDKYQELVATEALQTQDLSGDFADHGDNRYVWQATVVPTGTENLSALNVIVQPRDAGQSGPMQFASGVVYIPPVASAAPTTGGTP